MCDFLTVIFRLNIHVIDYQALKYRGDNSSMSNLS